MTARVWDEDCPDCQRVRRVEHSIGGQMVRICWPHLREYLADAQDQQDTYDDLRRWG